jgi:threonylcarbamoyladenosine tRNA methylthiotransferase CDKAL1
MGSKINFITLGCSANQAETEIMQGILSEKGHIIINERNDADIIVVNICTVKGDKTALEAIEEVTPLRKKLIIAGCIPPARSNVFRAAAPGAAFIKTDNIEKIGKVVEELEKNNPISLLGRNYDIKTNESHVRTNNNIAIIPINNSCNDACSFCGVKLIKGKLFSYPEDKIIGSIISSLKQGCKEIWITSQDTGAYGIDLENKCLLPELINKITELPFDFKLRVGMFNPMNIVGREQDLIEAYKNNKVYKFAHIPLQAGSDKILQLMKRRYTKKQFIQLIERFKKELPELTFATDIITGFPGETEQDFDETLEVMKITRPQVMHISRFQEIPNTAATLLPNKVHGKYSKERSRTMTQLRYSIAEQENRKWKDWEGECVILEKNESKGDYIGRNSSYLQVIVRQDKSNPQDLMNKKVRVKIEQTDKHYLIGELLEIIDNKPKIILRV